ncbi:hypothetical protein Q8A73_020047 [Channa argus]|nr:hypothetical protein Q8A73_020047 [Channa argus]
MTNFHSSVHSIKSKFKAKKRTRQTSGMKKPTAPLAVDVFVYLSGLGEAVLPALQRPHILSAHHAANQIAAFQTSFSTNITKTFTGQLYCELHNEILETISSAPVSQSRLVFEKKKPIPLKLLTPKIVEVLDYGKKRGSTREEREKERLKHKYKKEFKGALREIRKDSRFLAREKLNEILSSSKDTFGELEASL